MWMGVDFSQFLPDFKYISGLLLPFMYVYPCPFKHVTSVWNVSNAGYQRGGFVCLFVCIYFIYLSFFHIFEPPFFSISLKTNLINKSTFILYMNLSNSFFILITFFVYIIIAHISHHLFPLSLPNSNNCLILSLPNSNSNVIA